MIVLLHGADAFSSAIRRRELRCELDPDGYNTIVLDAADASLGVLRAACDTHPFFGGARYVEARGLLARWLAGKRGGRKAPANDPVHELIAYLPTLPSTTHLLFWEPTAVTLPSALEGEFRRQGATISRFEAPLGAELRQWVAARVTELGASIEPAAIVALLDATCPGGWREPPRGRDARPPNLARIDAELRKVTTAVLAVSTGPRVTARVVTTLVAGEQQANVFALVNAVTERDGPRAIGRLRALVNQGIAPEALLAMLARQYLLLEQLWAESRSPAAVEARPKQAAPAQSPHLERQLRALGASRVARGLELALEADRALKTGIARDAEEALYWLVLELCEIGPAGPPLVAVTAEA